MSKNPWRRLYESTEGPNVTIQIPREWAEELLRALATSLEVEDMGDEPDELGIPHMEPDEDDLGGLGDLDLDDGGELDLGDEDESEEPEFPAGDEDDDEGDSDPDDDSDDEESEDDGDDDDEKDEGLGIARPKTALGESAFARAGRLLGEHRTATRKAAARRRK